MKALKYLSVVMLVTLVSCQGLLEEQKTTKLSE